jgi:hypothetical protein
MKAGVLLIVAIAALIGCDPETTLSGRLTAVDGGAVAGATVRTVCSTQSGSMSAVTDKQGHFSTSGLGCIGDDCRLEVLVAGRAPLVLPMRSHCRGAVFACRNACSHLEVDAVVE